jgi:hypothetical protein
VRLYNSASSAVDGGDFSVNPATGGGDTAGSWFFVNADLDTFGQPGDTTIYLGFRFLTNSQWSGKIYIDDIRIQ